MAMETVRIDREEETAEQTVIPKDIRALQLLQMEYRGEIELTPTQRRAAIECLPFETPKLGVMATTNMSTDDFATMLDRAIARSQVGLKLIEHRPAEGEGTNGEGTKRRSALPPQAHWPTPRSTKARRF
jgi:hypothetical protein